MNAISSPAPASVSGSKRFHALDSVRAVAMLLGVVYHAILFGGGMMGGPDGGSNGGQALASWVHSFRMALFFLISGFFCHMMLVRYGLWPYLAKRWWRLGAAMVIYLFVLFGINQLTRQGDGRGPGRFGGFGPPGGPRGMMGSRSGGGPGAPGGPRGQPGPMAGPGQPGMGDNPTGGFGGPPDFGGPEGPDEDNGPGRPDRPGFPGPGGFSPYGFLASSIVEAADSDRSGTVSSDELSQLAQVWFRKLDKKPSGTITAKDFEKRFPTLFAPEPNAGGPNGGMPGFNPLMFLSRGMGPGVFKALDTDKDGVLREPEMSAAMGQWATWAKDTSGHGKSGLSSAQLTEGLVAHLPKIEMGFPGGPGGPFGNSTPVGTFLFGEKAGEFGMGPMWFLWFLIVFATVGPVIAWLFGTIFSGIPAERIDRTLSYLLRIGVFPILLAIAVVPMLWLDGTAVGQAPNGMSAISSTFPDVLFRYHPDWPYFMTWFMAGWLMYRLRDQLDSLGRFWLPTLIVGTVAHFYSETFTGGGMPFGPPQDDMEPSRKLLGYFVFAVAAAGTSFGLMGFFQQYLNKPAKVPRYLADTAFWVYLLHQELLIQAILPRLRPFGLPWWLQLILALALVVLIAVVTFELFVRRTPLTYLFGPTPPKKSKSKAAGITAPAVGTA